jgi:hypothetical protein
MNCVKCGKLIDFGWLAENTKQNKLLPLKLKHLGDTHTHPHIHNHPIIHSNIMKTLDYNNENILL